MTTGIGLRSFEDALHGIENIPEALLPFVVTAPSSSLATRMEGFHAWRSALLRGSLPSPRPRWPPPMIASLFEEDVKSLGLLRFCREQGELVDSLMHSLLGFEVALESHARKWPSIFQKLREIEEERLREKEASEKQTIKSKLDLDALQKKARLQAEEEGKQAIQAAFRRSWQDRVALWTEIESVFGEIGGLLGRGRDLSQGLLRSQGWLEIKKLQEMLKTLASLREIAKTLGRLHPKPGAPEEDPTETILGPMRRCKEEIKQTPTLWAASETKGIRRSGDISRMLPSEAAMLGHPVLRMLWHARRIEESLLSYQVEGVMPERITTEEEFQDAKKPTPPKERGPILLCIDTSGSMHGLPEQVAKALTLEVMRLAHGERRECHLYAFSGPGQVTSHALSLDEQGIQSLLNFLTMSFHGGTDLAEPLRQIIEKLQQTTWKKADVLLITDGEFRLLPETVASVETIKKSQNTRFHGVLIGSFRSSLGQICDPLHAFSSWQALLPA